MYEFKEVTLQNGPHEKKVLVIEFDEPKMGIIGEFLMADASLLDYQILDVINDVLSRRSDYELSTGNRCSLEIKQDKTSVSDLLAGMYDGFDGFQEIDIDTRELQALIMMWRDKLSEFNQ